MIIKTEQLNHDCKKQTATWRLSKNCQINHSNKLNFSPDFVPYFELGLNGEKVNVILQNTETGKLLRFIP